MIKLIISGCNGRMGQVVTRLAKADGGFEIVAGFDQNAVKLSDYPVYSHPLEYAGSADVVVDFSSPAALDALLSWCKAKNVPVILCSTGYSPEQLDTIKAASAEMPIFKSANMSLGINVLTTLIKRAAEIMGETFDIEIVEKHHNQKKDAPSGTAIMLADAVKEGLNYEPEYVYDRSTVRQPRDKKEIGISAVRAGTIPGEHTVIFAGTDEVIEFKHTAYSREIFAAGAVKAAKFMAGITAPGMYDMSDV
ncbi:MAG: 4-hydroxy-tetrahydrodipicolinate reductase, partial [Oscillospiraceae bacterium]|nr:4-hydroxy-tetrahydrodipicolinate reductase [Oscillospiraceae bacterium]